MITSSARAQPGGGDEMILFERISEIASDLTSQNSCIETPAGVVCFHAEIQGKSVSDSACDEVYSFENGGRILCWNSGDYDLELLICQPVFSLPERMKTDDCWAGMWRLKAAQPLPPITFSFEWMNEPQDLERGAESGECLDAQTWENEQSRITLGTQDPDYLFERAKAGDNLPMWWAADPDWISAHFRYRLVDYTACGFRVQLPGLKTNDFCQIQFVMAWSTHDPTGVATWYAVDRLPEDILKGMIR